MDAQWRIELLGRLQARHGEQVLPRFRSRKAAALLAYLAYFRRPHSRDELSARFWPQHPPGAARTQLRAALTGLRQQLPTGDPPGSLLLCDWATVQLDPAACSTDVAAFEGALRAAARAGSASERARWLAEAVDGYPGELLPGDQAEWILPERRWLAENFFRALSELIQHLEEEGQYEQALQHAHRGVRIDPLREEAQRDLIRLYAAVGQTGAALAQYRELERLLKERGEAPPDPTTRALAGEIERLAVIRPQASVAIRGSSLDAAGLSRELLRIDSAGENRLVTLLWADLRTFPQKAAGLRSADGTAPVNSLLTAIVEVLLRYGGRIVCFQDDGVLVLFGSPQTHEDDPERAIRAALEIRAGARRLGLEITAGINTGEIYLGETEPAPHHESPVAGPVVSLAARLREQAARGQILVSEATYLQTRRAFDFSSRSLQIKGYAEPTVAYVVERAMSRPQKPRGIEGLGAELVGREEELAKLREPFLALLRGAGQIVSLIGEAGVGKSRLVSELKREASEARGDSDRVWFPAGWARTESASGEPLLPGRGGASAAFRPPLWLEGRCLEHAMSTGYALFVDLFRDYFAWGPDENELARGERLAACLRGCVTRGDLAAERMEEIGPLLGHLLALRFGSDWDDRLKYAAPGQVRQQTFLAVRDFFVTLARRQPVVLVLEDLHWADRLSLDLIPLLIEALATAPLLLLCLYRPDPEHQCRHLATIAEQKSPERYTELRLRELPPEQSRRLLAALLTGEALPAAGKELILQRAHGNPFFVEEIVRSLISAGLIYQEGPVWRAREGIATAAVPESIQSVILSRVDRLRPALKQVLQGAAVIGRVFRRRLLERTVGEEIDLDRALWELEEEALIYQERVVPEEELSFRHVLTQETLYQNIGRQRRARFHRNVAEAMEALYPQRLRAYYERLAYHYERSNAVEKAASYLYMAGDKALMEHAHEEARRFYEQALHLADRHGLKGWSARARLDLAFYYWILGPNRAKQEQLVMELAGDLDRLDQHDRRRALTLLLEIHTARKRWEEARSTFALSLTHGGPTPLLFSIFLAEWEEQMEREGQHHLFTKLCREWESLAISAGTRSLLRQWFLEAAEPQNVGGQPLLDICFAKLLTEGAEAELSEPTRRDGLAKEAAGGTGPGQSGVSHLQPGASPPPQPAIPGQHRFRRVPGLGLPPELSWIDPVGVGPPDLQPGRPLILTPPLFLDLWPPSNVDAPRLMLSLEGEFVAETFVEVGEQSAALSGLLLWHSERDFVRLERVRSPSHGNGITLEGSVSGSYLHLGRGRFTAPGVWLRLERTGPNVRGLCSQDRKQWWTCGTAPFPSDGRAQVGLACVAHAAGATASFERFTVWKR